MPGLGNLSFQFKSCDATALKTQVQEPVVTSDETCSVCIQFAVDAINILLNLALGEWAWLGRLQVMLSSYVQCDSCIERT